MKQFVAGSIIALGMAAAPEAKAWVDLNFTVSNSAYPIWLTCEANYPQAPCVGSGTRGNTWIWYNPLDGDRWSKYTLWFDARPVQVWLYDERMGCSTGSGWGRGWSWKVYVRPALGGPWTVDGAEVCSGGGGGTERMKINAYQASPYGSYMFEVMGDAPMGSRPGVRLHFTPATNVLTKVLF